MLDFDADTGNIFAIVLEDSRWTAHISTDNGMTWTQTYTWSGDPILMDMAIVDGFVYVGYVTSSAPDEGRLRRPGCSRRARWASHGSGAPVGRLPPAVQTGR